jgi:hypothetical protein
MGAACAPAMPRGSLGAQPACPRDATVATITGPARCECSPGHPLLLGACVTTSVVDAYCGPASRPGEGRCVFRDCAGVEGLDADDGACVPLTSVVRSGPACPSASALIIDARKTACVPRDAACPRGTVPGASGRCEAPASCPPGALWDGHACQTIVTMGPRGAVVDVGTWANRVLGPDGGNGSAELCRPLQSAPGAFELSTGDHVTVRLAIALSVPDQDLSRAYAEVEASNAGFAPSAPPPDDGASQPTQSPADPAAARSDKPLPEAALARARQAVASLVEPLRALGGESSTAALAVRVDCLVSLTSPPSPPPP